MARRRAGGPLARGAGGAAVAPGRGSRSGDRPRAAAGRAAAARLDLRLERPADPRARRVAAAVAAADAGRWSLALGLDAERHEAELERAIAEAGEPPERILVVTDRLEFAPLLEAGVGFEHVPADGERQPELAGVPLRAISATAAWS